MDAYICPKGHSSQDSDYCSECGAKIQAAAASSAAVDSGPFSGSSGSSGSSGRNAVEHCPSCGAPRDTPGIAFCEICGWDFANGPATGAAPAPPPALEPDTQPETAAAAASEPDPGRDPAAPPSTGWSVTLLVDVLPAQPGSPQPPSDIVPQTVALTKPVTLIGRRSDVRAIYPEIPLQYDDAVSHRHALLQVDAEGALLLRDIGAANGTRLNGREIEPMIDHPVHDGDQITLGYWSRIVIKAVS
jgi:hypothetical protein